MKKIIKILLLSICISLILPPNSSKSIAYTYTSSFTTAPLQPPLRPEEYYPEIYNEIERRELLVIPYTLEESIIHQSSEANYPEVRFIVVVPLDVWKDLPHRPYKKTICTDTGYFAKVKFTLENNNNAPIQDELKWEIVNVTNEFGGLFRFRGGENENLPNLTELCKKDRKTFVPKELNFWPGLREGAEPEELIRSWPGLFYAATYSGDHLWDYGFDLGKINTVTYGREIINGLNAPCNTEVELDLSKGVNVIAIKCWFADPKATYNVYYWVEVKKSEPISPQTITQPKMPQDTDSDDTPKYKDKPEMKVYPEKSLRMRIYMLDNVSLVRDNNPTPPPKGESYDGDPGPFVVDGLELTPDEYYPPDPTKPKKRLPYDQIKYILGAYQKKKSKGENVELIINGVPDWLEVAGADICNDVYFNKRNSKIFNVFKCVWGFKINLNNNEEYFGTIEHNNGIIYCNITKDDYGIMLRYNYIPKTDKYLIQSDHLPEINALPTRYRFYVTQDIILYLFIHEAIHILQFLHGPDVKDGDDDWRFVSRSTPDKPPAFIRFSWDHKSRGSGRWEDEFCGFYQNSDNVATELSKESLAFFKILKFEELTSYLKVLLTGEKIELSFIPYDYPKNADWWMYANQAPGPDGELPYSWYHHATFRVLIKGRDPLLTEIFNDEELNNCLDSVRVVREPALACPENPEGLYWGKRGFYIPAKFVMYSERKLPQEKIDQIIASLKNRIQQLEQLEGGVYLMLKVTITPTDFPISELDADYFSIIDSEL